MISSPSLRSVPTLNSRRVRVAERGQRCSAPPPAAAPPSAQRPARSVQATPRRSKSRRERRGGEERAARDGRRGEGGALRRSASLSCIGNRFPFVSLHEYPTPIESPLTHFDAHGQAHMVDVSAKAETHRVARASGTIRMLPGDAGADRVRAAPRRATCIGVARIAAIQGAKRTAELVPLCHPIAITRVARRVRGRARAPASVRCTAQVETLRPHRRRDGGADRRAGRPADRLRHVQGGRPRDGDRRRPPAREARRQVGRLAGRRGRRRVGAI